MRWTKAFNIGFGLTLTGLLVCILLGFVYGLNLDIPLLLTISSNPGPMPNTSLEVNLLGASVFALLLSVIIRYTFILLGRTKNHAKHI